VPVIGVLNGLSAAGSETFIAAVHRGLGETGFVEGRNVAFEYRWAEGAFEKLPAMAADLVKRRVSVILAGGTLVAVRAAMAATRTIPIVFTIILDPVNSGLVASLNHPGGNVTGITRISTELIPKLLELARETLPDARRIALLVNPSSPENADQTVEGARTAARALGIELLVLHAASEGEIDQAFEAAVKQRAAALVLNNAYLSTHRARIISLSVRHALPVISNSREDVAGGMLMSYDADASDFSRQAGVYVGRILKGEKPGDLPVMRPTKFELTVNLKTAKALGLSIPESFLARADEVIE